MSWLPWGRGPKVSMRWMERLAARSREGEPLRLEMWVSDTVPSRSMVKVTVARLPSEAAAEAPDCSCCQASFTFWEMRRT